MKIHFHPNFPDESEVLSKSFVAHRMFIYICILLLHIAYRQWLPAPRQLRLLYPFPFASPLEPATSIHFARIPFTL
jgi:hypothetical protein